MAEATTENNPDWKQLETLVAMIQKQLSPNATVQHNAMLDGIDSETKRQIDVLVEQNIGQYTMRIVIDCKDYAKPIDVKGVEEFHGLVQDVRAHKGALVCPSGFTKAALKRAQKLQIDLYRPVSTGQHKWKATVTAPIVCDFRSAYMSFGIRCTTPKPMKLQHDLYTQPAWDEYGNILDSCLMAAQKKWNAGLFPSEPGEYERVPIFGDTKVLIENGYNDKVEVELTVKLLVKQNLYLGHLPVEDINGLQDVYSGDIVTNAFTLGGLEPQKVKQNWLEVEDIESLEFRPLFKVVGYDCYGVGT